MDCRPVHTMHGVHINSPTKEVQRKLISGICRCRYEGKWKYPLNRSDYASPKGGTWRNRCEYVWLYKDRIQIHCAGSPTPCADGCHLPCTWRASWRNFHEILTFMYEGCLHHFTVLMCVCVAMNPNAAQEQSDLRELPWNIDIHVWGSEGGREGVREALLHV